MRRECIQAFNNGAEKYDSWFDNNTQLFSAELAAVKSVLPSAGDGIEIGCGTGRFGIACGIMTGVEPADGMAGIAERKGMHVIKGCAEALPIENDAYDFAAMITVDCFLQDVLAAFKEVSRILKDSGFFVVAFLNKDSPLGRLYEENKSADELYKHAIFHTSDEIERWLTEAHFSIRKKLQTIDSLNDKEHSIYEGAGRCLFTVIQAQKQKKGYEL